MATFMTGTLRSQYSHAKASCNVVKSMNAGRESNCFHPLVRSSDVDDDVCLLGFLRNSVDDDDDDESAAAIAPLSGIRLLLLTFIWLLLAVADVQEAKRSAILDQTSMKHLAQSSSSCRQVVPPLSRLRLKL
jgi:hypothetical protein